jgi:hypothetical protein
MTTREREVLCHRNIAAWAAHHGMDQMPVPVRAYQDRCYYPAAPLSAWVAGLVDNGTLKPGNYRNHGASAMAGWREARGRTSAQIVEHLDAGQWLFEIDFDHWNPWDVAGILGHAWEVFTNKLARRRTCPKAIAEALGKRGIHVAV